MRAVSTNRLQLKFCLEVFQGDKGAIVIAAGYVVEDYVSIPCARDGMTFTIEG